MTPTPPLESYRVVKPTPHPPRQVHGALLQTREKIKRKIDRPKRVLPVTRLKDIPLLKREIRHLWTVPADRTRPPLKHPKLYLPTRASRLTRHRSLTVPTPKQLTGLALVVEHNLENRRPNRVGALSIHYCALSFSAAFTPLRLTGTARTTWCALLESVRWLTMRSMLQHPFKGKEKEIGKRLAVVMSKQFLGKHDIARPVNLYLHWLAR